MKVTVQEIIDAMQQALDYANAKESDGYAEHWTLRANTHVSVDWSLIRRLIAKIKQHGIAVEYTPMTNDEFEKLLQNSEVYNEFAGWEWEREIEQAVLARLGVAPTLDQAKQICEQAGFAIVPVEPTKAMRSAGNIKLYDLRNDLNADIIDKAFYIYDAMLEAAKEVKP